DRDRVVKSEPDEGPSPGSPDYHPGRQAAGLLWTGPTLCIEVSLTIPGGVAVSGLRAAFVNTSGTAGPLAAAATVERTPATAEPTAAGPAVARRSGTRPPTIITRAQWGADPRYLDSGTPGCRAPYYSPRV